MLTTMPDPAALWVLYRHEVPLEPSVLAAALGEGARVDRVGEVLSVRVREHTLRVLSFRVPVREDLAQACLQVAHLGPEQKEELASHAAHALVVHDSEEPGADGLIALYETAWALRGAEGAQEAIVGVINPITCMCLTTDMLAQTMAPEFVEAVRANPAESLALWLGFVKLFKPDGTTWLVTRGGPLVGLPDLAWLAKDLAETDRVYELFAGVLEYAYTTGTELVVGDAVDFGERPVLVRAPYEHVDEIGEETLVLEPR
jgi:hypothetical protein